ncbi:MAG: GDSL-type esterase/lipase family protein [Bacteroidales bacterium]|nr:GDSL-type esterase/lipase family protein [Bacteroidales bacterium]
MKRLVYIIISCLLPLLSMGQAKPKYPFIVDSMNVIQIPNGKSENLNLFYNKLLQTLQTNQGQISILHIGGSHIQADMMSHQIRSHFDSLFPETHASRGLIFPFETAKTNNPYNYKVTHKGTWTASRNVRESRIATLGLTGIAVTSADSLPEITINLNPDEEQHRWFCTKLSVLGYTDSKLVEPKLLANDTIYSAKYDSTLSTYIFQLDKPTELFTLQIQQNDTIRHNFTINGFYVENNDCGIVYNAVGVNGASVPSYLSCENFERDLHLIKPDLMIFAIGINDAVPENFSDSTFISNYDSLLTKIQRVAPNCAFIFVTNNDSYRKIKGKKSSYYSVNRNGLRVERDFYELAQKHNGAVWDMFAIMGGLQSMPQWEAMGLAQKDKVHFTKKGYKLLGDMFYSALIRSYNKTMLER